MEIRKLIYLTILFCTVLSCKKAAPQEQENKASTAVEKAINNTFEQIPYINKSVFDGRINIFEFKDGKISVEYLSETIFGLGNNKNFSIYKSNGDLDLGELDLLRFDNFDSQIYFLELKDGREITYNIYIIKEKKVYHLGALDFEILEQKRNEKISKSIFNIKEKSETLEIEIITGTKIVKKEFKIEAALPIDKSFNGIQNYLELRTAKDAVKTNFSKEYENEIFLLGINNDVLSVTIRENNIEYLNYEILEGYSFCPDVHLEKIVLKDTFFTVEKYNCNNEFYFKEFLTFKYDHNIFLQKYSVEYTLRKNPDQDVKIEHFTTKDFGVIKFNEVNKELLTAIRQK